MAQKICAICGKEISKSPDCMHYDFSKFSIELELLGLSSELEHYDILIETEQFTSSLATAPKTARSIQSWPMPLFLRL